MDKENARSLAVFVNVYALESHYGGPEEGGWEYTAGTPGVSKATTCLEAYYEVCGCSDEPCDCPRPYLLLTKPPHSDVCPAGHWQSILRDKYSGKAKYAQSYTHNAHGVSYLDIADDAPAGFAGELVKSGSYAVKIEGDPGEDYPSQRPHYE